MKKIKGTIINFRDKSSSAYIMSNDGKVVEYQDIDLLRKKIGIYDKNGNKVEEGVIVATNLENNKLTLETPDGKQKVYDVLKFIVTLLPLIEKIILFFKNIFAKKQ